MSHNNKEVAHLWANQSRAEASGSHFFFTGDTIYSYGSHFPIARHYKGTVLFTSKGYSNSTARHKSIVRGASHHLPTFTVADPLRDPSGQDVKDYAAEIKRLALNAGKARNPASALEMLQSEVNEANAFCERFGFKTRFEMPTNLDELKARAAQSAERERKQKIARQAKLEAEAQEKIQQWLAGASVTIPHEVSKTYLRVRPENINREQVTEGAATTWTRTMETSRGARVPLAEAEKAFRFAMIHRARGWKRNGERFAVGDYQLDAINEQGVIAGCHRIAWDEVERFAKSQGWI